MLCLKHAGLNTSTSTFFKKNGLGTHLYINVQHVGERGQQGPHATGAGSSGSPAPAAMPAGDWGRLNRLHQGTESCFRALVGEMSTN